MSGPVPIFLRGASLTLRPGKGAGLVWLADYRGSPSTGFFALSNRPLLISRLSEPVSSSARWVRLRPTVTSTQGEAAGEAALIGIEWERELGGALRGRDIEKAARFLTCQQS